MKERLIKEVEGKQTVLPRTETLRSNLNYLLQIRGALKLLILLLMDGRGGQRLRQLGGWPFVCLALVLSAGTQPAIQ